MLAKKIQFVGEKLAKAMPAGDGNIFNQLINAIAGSLQNGAANVTIPNVGTPQMQRLASAIVSDLSKEKMNPATGSAKKCYGGGCGGYDYGYGGYGNYWYNPWYYNYWYNYWSPYYWWGWDPYFYDGISYIGGSGESEQVSSSSVGTAVFGQPANIRSMNLLCDDNDMCELNVSYQKLPM